jgi:hypothetical protein
MHQLLENALWLLLRAEASCNFFQGEALVSGAAGAGRQLGKPQSGSFAVRQLLNGVIIIKYFSSIQHFYL